MSRGKRVNRNSTIGPMTPFVRHSVPPEAEQEGVLAVFDNNRYVVFIKKQPSPGYTDPEGKPIEMVHMIISRKDGKATRSWGDLQRIKRELLGDMVDAVELFPAGWRDMREIKDSQMHLWALPPGANFPFGLVPAGLDTVSGREQSKMEELMVSKEEIEVFVVRTSVGDGEIAEVFANEAEAAEMYKKQNLDLPESTAVMRIGDVPSEGENVGWTEEAKKKVAVVIAKAEAAAKYMRESVGAAEGDILDPVVPGGIEEEIEAEDGGYADQETMEDRLLLASAMQRRMDRRKAEAEARVKEVEGVVEDAAEDVEACEQAAVDLAEMRERFVRTGDIQDGGGEDGGEDEG